MDTKTSGMTVYCPSMGVLVPSPLISHTHAIATVPFDPNALLTVKERLKYLPEHAIDSFPPRQQAIQHAGQIVVAREMEKLRKAEFEARRFRSLPEVKLNIHQNPKVNAIEDSKYWRKILGWSGSLDANERKRRHRYSTVVPGKKRLLKGVYDKYNWNHDDGKWKITTHSGIHEATARREWVCKELERIDALRYDVMANIQKQRQINDAPISEKDLVIVKENEPTKMIATTHSFTRPNIIGSEKSAELSPLPTANKARASIEPPFEISSVEIVDSQTTRSSFAEAFTISPDAEHEVRSQAPEPESPIKEDFPHQKGMTEDLLKRYRFILDIPTTDSQRVEWIKFLDKYEWDHGMISALRSFFMTDIPPNMTQTAAFLNKLKEVCATIAVVSSNHGEQSYRLLWDSRVPTIIIEAVVEVARSPSPPAHTSQPALVTTPRFLPICADTTHTPVAPSNTTVSLTEQPDLEIDEDIQLAMKKYVTTLNKGDRVEPPCDRCRELSIDCRINKTSCKSCADTHSRCMWSEVEKAITEEERSPTHVLNTGTRIVRKRKASEFAVAEGWKRTNDR